MKKSLRTSAFFDWPNKETKELGIVRHWLESSGQSSAIVEVRPGRPDPPDAIARRDDGALVAIEVTELVDGDVLAHNVKARREQRDSEVVFRYWSESEVRAKVAELLRVKDGVLLQGGPFSSVVVVLHCDEMTINSTDARKWLEGHDFGEMMQIDQAVLLLSYDPHAGEYPCIPLTVRRRGCESLGCQALS